MLQVVYLKRISDLMNSSNHPAAYGYQPHSQRQPSFPPRPPVNESTLKTGNLQIERKNFQFTIKENLRGRLLRITEDTGGHFNSIIIPATGLTQFRSLLDEMIKANEEKSGSQKP